MAWREGRLGRRMTLRVRVFLESLDGSKPREITHTENVSTLGLCALSQCAWRVREELGVIVAHSGPQRHARVVHCTPREDGRFAVGIAWGSAPINWADVVPEAAAS
jgi:hypothetical protein